MKATNKPIQQKMKQEVNQVAEGVQNNIPLHPNEVVESNESTENIVDPIEAENKKLKEENENLKATINQLIPYFKGDIPKSFTMGGIKIDVTSDGNSEDQWGIYRPRKASIEISKTFNGEEINEDVRNATFYHELVHCIFDSISEDKLYTNERLVDNIAKSFRIFLLSRRFE